MKFILQSSSAASGPKFFQRRLVWIILAALILSAILFSLIRVYDRPDEKIANLTDSSQLLEEEMIGVKPARILQISEFTDGSAQKLRLAGDGEPNGIIVLTNRGERLRQIPVNELGQWGLTLNVEDEGMALEAHLYIDEAGESIRSEETIFRIPVPKSEDEATNYRAESLLLVTAPGVPSRIVQSPFGGFPTSGPLSLSVIDYDYAGGVSIAGSSSVPGRIRIYAQDAVIGDVGIGVSGRWTYIAGRMLPRDEVEIRIELIPAPGFPNAPLEKISLSVPYKFMPPLREDSTEGGGALFVNFDTAQWQVRRTLIGGGGQSTIIFAPEISE